MSEELQKENEKEKFDDNAKDIIKKASKDFKLTDTEIKRLLEEFKNNFDFNKLLDELKKRYPLDNDKYVIFTNGNEQLYYENGEFFIISAVDSKDKKTKIKRKEALDLYNEYYIMNVLNPLLKQKQVNCNVVVTDAKQEIEAEAGTIENEVKQEEQSVKGKKLNNEKDQIESEAINSEVKERLEKLKEKEKELKQKRKLNKKDKENKVR